MGPLVTVDAHCCIRYYTYIQYTLLYIHTVYITMHTYSIHYYTYIQYTLLCIHTVYITMHTYSIHYYAYLQYTLLCIHTVYITMHTYSIHTVCMFLYVQTCTACMQQIYKGIIRTVPRIYIQSVCVECCTLVLCVYV